MALKKTEHCNDSAEIVMVGSPVKVNDTLVSRLTYFVWFKR